MPAGQFASSQQNDYHMNGHFGHQNQAQAASRQSGMTYHQSGNNFGVYEDEEQHAGMFDLAGNVTPQPSHREYFDMQDENAPNAQSGRASPPGYHGYGYDDQFDDLHYRQ